MDYKRNEAIEMQLQTALDDGANVWVIGDIHGFYQSFISLIDELNLGENDRVVLLGDLIDRGPNSYGVVHTARTNEQIFCVKGNHEAMMAENFSLEGLQDPNIDLLVWIKNGGDTTVRSYLNAFNNVLTQPDHQAMKKQIKDDNEWIETLPLHIVLKEWRLVHAGYKPNLPLDEQTEDEYLWIRKEFHEVLEPVDHQRTVVFGHTPTASLPGHGEQSWGKVWRSEVCLNNARPAAIGLDTCLYHAKQGMPAVLTAFNLQDGRVVQQNRVEP